MAPKANSLLKYVKLDRLGRLTYERKIPPRLRKFLGNKASIRRSLGVDSTDCRDPQVLTAYSKVHGEIDALITQAEGQLAGALDVIAGNTGTITPHLQTFPLSQRQIAGIAAQVLLNVRHAVEHQQSVGPELGRAIQSLAIKAVSGGTSSVLVADFAALARPVLDDLGIHPSQADMHRIGASLLAYMPTMIDDMKKLKHLDYSPPRLQEIAPPLPTRSVTWQDLFDGWALAAGGITEEDGFGVGKDRHRVYQTAIKEFQREITDQPPNEITIDQARSFVRWLQTKSGHASGTQRTKLLCLRNLLKIGIRDGVIEANPFQQFKITTPAGAIDQSGYRSFTRAELIQIFTVVNSEKHAHNRFIPWILITSGCRLAEALQLRTTDIKKTAAGIWFFDWRHEPTAKYPMLLKTKAENERMCPLHPMLIEAGVLKLDRRHEGRLFPNCTQHNAAHSKHFMKLLQRLGIWEKKKTCLHSFRNNAKEFWREAEIPLDYRNGLTGHQAIGAGEKHYGKLLNSMPDKLYAQLIKVDLSWMPL